MGTDVEVAAGTIDPRTTGIACSAEWNFEDLVPILFFHFESVELERGKRSECVADFDAHSLGVECRSEWRTRAVHAWKTLRPDQAQKFGKDGWTKAVGERADGLQLEWYRSDGFDGFDGSRGSDGVEGCDGVAVPSGAGIKVAQVLGLQGDLKIFGDELANDDGTKSFSWVQKSQTGGQKCWNPS